MYQVVARLRSVSPYTQSKKHWEEKLGNETHEEFDKRTWMHKLHRTEDGHIYIPGASIKFALDAAAKFSSEKIVGKGAATWTKHFASGVIVQGNIVLPYTANDVQVEALFVNLDGIRGSGKRGLRYFPTIKAWEGTIEFVVVDPMINRDVFVRYLEYAGKIIGIGTHRPEKGGFKGRFEVVSVDWKEM